MAKPLPAASGLEGRELERLRQRVEWLFTALQEAADERAVPPPGALVPPMDLCESDEAVTLRMELAGVPAESIEVSLTSTQLRVTGRKKKSAPRGRVVHLCSERSYGYFSRTVALRWPVSVRETSAELRRGVLTIRLPKLKERRGAEYKIKVTSDE